MKDRSMTTCSNTSGEQDINAFFQEELLPSDSDVLQYRYWKNKTNLPTLRKLAKYYLCIPPATIFSERLFSTTGLMFDKKRNRLDLERVWLLVFLIKNLWLLIILYFYFCLLSFKLVVIYNVCVFYKMKIYMLAVLYLNSQYFCSCFKG